jgi:hypothetical protein
MKTLLSMSLFASLAIGIVSFAGVSPKRAIVHPALAPDNDDESEACSNETLRGRYGFLRTGQNNALPGPIASLGQVTFDGHGNATENTVVTSRNGVITEGGSGTGNYVVNSDCTGYFTGSDGSKGDDFVVVQRGRKLLEMSTQPGRIVTAVVEKEK